MRSLAIISALLIGVMIGLLSVGLTIMTVIKDSSEQNGAWHSNPYVGSKDASGYLRATISIIGFLGMSKKESMYFVAREDENGDALLGDCTYKVQGKLNADIARWWSITVYNAITSKLIPNDQNQYSYNGDNIQLNDEGGFSIVVSPDLKQDNWIPVQKDTRFDLTLRLYNPSDTARDKTETLSLPKISKEFCK